MFFNDMSGRPHSRGSASASTSDARDDGPSKKRRRIQRACDMCRLKKSEGGQASRKACYNCVVANYDCTYVQTAKVEDRDKQYTRSLETRLVKLEQALRKHCPDSELLQNAWETRSAGTPSSDVASPGSITPLFNTDNLANEYETDSDDEDLARATLAENLEHVSLDPGAPDFFGKSSSMMVLQTAIDVRDGGAGAPPRAHKAFEKRAAFWDSYTWTTRPTGSRYIFSFPPDDLIHVLSDIYFREFNPFYPLLHRPTFDRGVAEGLHQCDEGFASTVLLVCAHGARFSDDPRVCPGHSQNHDEAGFQWFNQVKATLKVVCDEAPRLYDLQIAYLVASFTHMLPNPQHSWPVVGYGIRLAQALGAHRRKVYSNMPPVAAELLKRAFWALIQIDRELSYHMGRPCAMQDEDFDVDLPIDCDDGYWEDSVAPFKQPEGKPSQISYFSAAIRLNRIQSFATRSLYSIRKSRVQHGQSGPEWEERTVRDLDSALNKWLSSLPAHLRWDPSKSDSVFFNQSASLHGAFHQLQMAVHFPLLSLRKNRPSKSTDLPSLTICTNAARSCIQILQLQYERAMAEGTSQLAHFGCLFLSGLILLLNIWGTKHAGTAADIFRDVEYVHKAMNLLKALEPRYHFGGRMGDALFELTRAGGLPLPQDPSSPYAAHTAAAMAPQHNAGTPSGQSQIFVPQPVTSPSVSTPTQQPLEMSPFAPSSAHDPEETSLSSLPTSSDSLPEFSPDAIEQFMRTLAGISGDAAAGGWSAEQMAAGLPQQMPVGEDMFAMFTDVGAAMQWSDWAAVADGLGGENGEADA